MSSRCAAILFVKEPLPGRVKTRLAESIGDDAAAGLYRKFVRSVYSLLKGSLFGPDIHVFFASDERTAPESISELLDPAPSSFRAQLDSDLGSRMKHALEILLDSGYERVVLLGSDSPTLPTSYVDDAFDALAHAGMVFGPTDDGGYYLVGATEVYPELFEQIPWSTTAVLKETMKKADAHTRNIEIIRPWFDVDQEVDLARLPTELRTP